MMNNLQTLIFKISLDSLINHVCELLMTKNRRILLILHYDAESVLPASEFLMIN